MLLRAGYLGWFMLKIENTKTIFGEGECFTTIMLLHLGRKNSGIKKNMVE